MIGKCEGGFPIGRGECKTCGARASERCGRPPPAPASIAPELLHRVRSLLCAVIDAEPGGMAADGVTVLDVWRKECDALLAALTNRSTDK